MSDRKTTTGGGISFLGLLTIVFIALKLCDKIDWSWLWVLSPLWIPIILFIAIWVLTIIYYVTFKNK